MKKRQEYKDRYMWACALVGSCSCGELGVTALTHRRVLQLAAEETSERTGTALHTVKGSCLGSDRWRGPDGWCREPSGRKTQAEGRVTSDALVRRSASAPS